MQRTSLSDDKPPLSPSVSPLALDELILLEKTFGKKKNISFNNLLYKTTPHIEKLAETHPAIRRQFYPTEAEARDESLTMADPLLEENHTVVKGLVHKYGNRALVLLTMNCAAYCRFCTRRRKVSDVRCGLLSEKDLDEMVVYLKKHPEISELILSGGDPMTVPFLLQKALERFTALPQIRILRVGTRLPVVSPDKINERVINALKVVTNKPLYLMLNFEHPAEITDETIAALQRLRPYTTMMFSQSVFLKGVNDSYEVLKELFTRLLEIGVKPYYIYHCDPVKGAEHFIVPVEREAEIMTELRKYISGLACPTHVIDTPNGSGKVPVPTLFWDADFSHFKDFHDEHMVVCE